MTETLGPPDAKAATRAKLYSGLALVTPLLSFLASFGVFTGDQANALIGFATAGVGVLSAFGFGLAATKTNAQLKDGTFEPAPPAPADPVGDVFGALGDIKTRVDDVVAHAAGQVAGATALIQGAATMLPGGPLVTAAVLSGPVGDLVQAMADRAKTVE